MNVLKGCNYNKQPNTAAQRSVWNLERYNFTGFVTNRNVQCTMFVDIYYISSRLKTVTLLYKYPVPYDRSPLFTFKTGIKRFLTIVLYSTLVPTHQFCVCGSCLINQIKCVFWLWSGCGVVVVWLLCGMVVLFRGVVVVWSWSGRGVVVVWLLCGCAVSWCGCGLGVVWCSCGVVWLTFLRQDHTTAVSRPNHRSASTGTHFSITFDCLLTIMTWMWGTTETKQNKYVTHPMPPGSVWA